MSPAAMAGTGTLDGSAGLARGARWLHPPRGPLCVRERREGGRLPLARILTSMTTASSRR
jgi:hypothetical protein